MSYIEVPVRTGNSSPWLRHWMVTYILTQDNKKNFSFYSYITLNLLLCSLHVHNKITAPPEITVERSWVHASEGYDIELACIIHGDVTSDVSAYSSWTRGYKIRTKKPLHTLRNLP